MENYNFMRRDYWFGTVDSRPVGAFRIALAGILLKDALYHLWLARDFYSESGIVPVAGLRDQSVHIMPFSPMEALTQPWMVSAFFGVWVIVLVGLLVGYRTRMMSILNLLIILAVHERNIYVLDGADSALRVMSVWSVFLPLGHAYGWDAAWGRRASAQRAAYAFPVRMAQLQVGIIYLFTALLKIAPGGASAWVRGEALAYALQLRSYTLPSGDWLLATAPLWLLAALTYYTLLSELAFPVLVFFPVKQPSLRANGLVLTGLLHVGIAITLSIPNFSAIMLATYLLFFDSEWMDWLDERVAPIRQRVPPTSQPAAAAFANGWSQRIVRPVTTTALAILMGAVLRWNVGTLEINGQAVLVRGQSLPEIIVETSGLWQTWGMFAPYPNLTDGWTVAPGTFENGLTYDLLTGEPVSDEPRRWLWGPQARWKKFNETIFDMAPDALLGEWAAHYCREYANLPTGQRLQTVEIRYIFRFSQPPGDPPAALRERALWQQSCDAA